MARHNWSGLPAFEPTRPSAYPVITVGHGRRRRRLLRRMLLRLLRWVRS